MFWFQLKTKYGYIRVKYSGENILKIYLNGKVQKKDKHYKVYHELKDDLSEYFNGQKIDFNKYKISFDDLRGFQKKVLEYTRLIPYGNTKSYSQLAGDAGNLKAGRAAGNALNRNPAPVLIPCHRVIQKDGRSGGFSAGAKWKKALLLLENNKLDIDKNNDNMLQSN